MDPIHPGAEFLLPAAQGNLPPSTYSPPCLAPTISSQGASPSPVHMHHLSRTSTIPAHLCSSTIITTAHQRMPHHPQYIVSSMSSALNTPHICTVAAQCHEYSSRNSLPVCETCPTCSISSGALPPTSSNIPVMFESTDIQHLPPPVMFQKQADILPNPTAQPPHPLPHQQHLLAVGDNIPQGILGPSPSSLIPASSSFQDVQMRLPSPRQHQSCGAMPQSAISCRQCIQIPVQIEQPSGQKKMSQASVPSKEGASARASAKASGGHRTSSLSRRPNEKRASDDNNSPLPTKSDRKEGAEEPLLSEESLTESRV